MNKTRSAVRPAMALTLALGLLVGNVFAQEPNNGAGSMTFNGVDNGTYPIQASILTPNPLTIDIGGAPTAAGQPFIMVQAIATLPTGIPIGGGEIQDLNPVGWRILMDGFQPGANLINLFAVLDNTGVTQINLPVVGQQASVVNVGAFQTVVFDPASILGFTLTAATTLILNPPASFGTVNYARGATAASMAAFSISAPEAPVSNAAMPADFDLATVRAGGFQHLSSASNSHPWWQKDFSSLPAGLFAMNVIENSAFPYVRTRHGNLYSYKDNVTDTYGFALDTGSGPVPIASTLSQPSPSGTVSAIETEIGVGQNRFAYVLNPSQAGNTVDQVFLASLDGPTLSGGVDLVDVTPASPAIVGFGSEGLTFTTNHLSFVGDPVISTGFRGLLFTAPNDGSAAATQVVLPPVTATMAVPTMAVAEMRYTIDKTAFLFQAGDTATSEDLYWFQDIAPGVFIVTNLTQFPVATEIEEFGDASDGTDNQVAISPLNTRVAFVTRVAAKDVLNIVTVAAPGVVTTVTTPLTFDATVDEVLELHWADENSLIFFAGATQSAMEMYRYDVSLGLVINMTNTDPANGSPPFVGGNIDPDEMFFDVNRNYLYWVRDGGLDGSGNATRNLVALNLQTLTLQDVTGSEFSGGTGPDIDGGFLFHLHFARSSNTVCFISELSIGTDDNVFAFDGSIAGPAIALTGNTASNGRTIDNATMNDAGTRVAFGDDVPGQDNVFKADTAIANSAIAIYMPSPFVSTGGMSDGSIRWTNADQFVFAYGSGSTTTPTNSQLILHDGILGNLNIDSITGAYVIF